MAAMSTCRATASGVDGSATMKAAMIWAISGAKIARNSHSALEQQRKQKSKCQPEADVKDSHDGENQHPPELFCVGRKADKSNPKPYDQKENRGPENCNRGKAGEKFTVDQAVAVDGLRKNATEGSARVFAADGIEAKHDADQRAQETKKSCQRQQAAALRSQQ